MRFVADTVTLGHLFPSTSVSPCHCHFTYVSYLFILISVLTEEKSGDIWETSKEAVIFILLGKQWAKHSFIA
jgi:hypothetical protein